MRMFASLVVTALVALLASPVQAASCPALITAPCTITQDGSYILAGDLDGDGLPHNPVYGTQQPIIEIAAGVTQASINCNGYALRNSSGFFNRGVGIGGKLVANIDIFGACRIVGDGMMFCVFINNESNMAFRNIKFRDSTCSGTLRGVKIVAHGHEVTNNFFLNAGGQQVWCQPGPGHGIPQAIENKGNDGKITGNEIYGVYDKCYQEVAGIAVTEDCDNLDISNNIIVNDRKGGVQKESWAIWLGPCTNVKADDIIIRNWIRGFTTSSPTGSTGTINRLVTQNTTTPLTNIFPPNWTVNP